MKPDRGKANKRVGSIRLLLLSILVVAFLADTITAKRIGYRTRNRSRASRQSDKKEDVDKQQVAEEEKEADTNAGPTIIRDGIRKAILVAALQGSPAKTSNEDKDKPSSKSSKSSVISSPGHSSLHSYFSSGGSGSSVSSSSSGSHSPSSSSKSSSSSSRSSHSSSESHSPSTSSSHSSSSSSHGSDSSSSSSTHEHESSHSHVGRSKGYTTGGGSHSSHSSSGHSSGHSSGGHSHGHSKGRRRKR